MFKFIENFVEFLAMAKIALSPILVFALIGMACYHSFESPMNIVLGVIFSALGVVLGVWWAIHVHKKHSAVEFNSRLSATPELDKDPEK